MTKKQLIDKNICKVGDPMILLGSCRDCKRLFNKPKELEDKDICPVCGSENWRYTLQRECDLHNPTGGSNEIFQELSTRPA